LYKNAGELDMKTLSLLLLLAGLITACQHKETKKVEVNTSTFMVDAEKHEVDSLLIGEKDTAFVVKNKVAPKDVGINRAIDEIHILFSNKNWPLLYFKHAVGANLFMAGDISGDEKPELLLQPRLVGKCWSSVNLYSLKNNAWQLLKTGGMYVCNDEYPLALRLEKTNNTYYLVTDTMVKEKIVIDKKEIRF
jgi:hypothetical protein